MDYVDLTEDDMSYIRAARGLVTQKELGEMFDVSQAQISHIQTGVKTKAIRRNSWKLGRMYSGGPTEQATPHDIIWAAGIYEGEGSCVYNAGSERASVPQKGRWLVDKLQALFGGSVTVQGGTENDMWAWVVYGARARGFLQSIYEMLSPRRQKQVLVALGRYSGALDK